jgi:uncharacterized protein YbcV (DUF1398 family)
MAASRHATSRPPESRRRCGRIQAQKIKYREFCVRIADAGCVGYLVSLVGRRAVYYGRSGESYVEPFPTAK